MEVKLYVGNLSYQTTEDDLRTMFAQTGTVSEVALIKDRDTGSSKGFAFVTMSSQAEATKAIETFNGKSMGERNLTVNVARPRENSGGGGGGYRGNTQKRSGGRW
jgi:cold-inducible RNA-binding protein